MAIGLNSDGSSRVSVNDNQEIDLVTNSQSRFRIEPTGQIKAVYESTVGTDYNTTLHNGYLCRAWVNFDGTGAVAIRASGNVSTILDNGIGYYTVNFTTAMPDANYSFQGTGSHANTGVNGIICTILNTSPPSVSSVTFRTQQDNVGVTDSVFVNVAVFR